MKTAAVSEFKARLSRYLRLVKSGVPVEIQDRGVPIAIVSRAPMHDTALFVPPRKDPKRLATYRFSVRGTQDFDAAQLLIDERRKS